MKQIVAIFAALIVLGFSQTAAADRGMCPAFSAADIDAAFAEWSSVNAFNPSEDKITCLDDRSVPYTVMTFYIYPPDATFADFVVVVDDDGNLTGNVSCDSRDIDVSDQTVCDGTDGIAAIDLDIGEKHICRAEVLRSFTWRQYCSQIVDRSQKP